MAWVPRVPAQESRGLFQITVGFEYEVQILRSRLKVRIE
jgi:hypothetical protein